MVPEGTTTPTTSRAPKSTNGSITARCEVCRRLLKTWVTRPTGTPVTYGAPPWLPHVTTTSPLAGTHGVVDQLEVEPAAAAEVAAAVQEAHLHALADPAADHRVGVDDEQHGGGRPGHPQHPADQSVGVDHGLVGGDAGAGSRRRW